jgi:hypothetical protein
MRAQKPQLPKPSQKQVQDGVSKHSYGSENQIQSSQHSVWWPKAAVIHWSCSCPFFLGWNAFSFTCCWLHGYISYLGPIHLFQLHRSSRIWTQL